MTNYEYYKEQIERATRMGGKAAVNKDTGEVAPCSKTDCTRCLFFGNSGRKCTEVALSWADEEYVEFKADWSKVPVDTPVLVSSDGKRWLRRYFAKTGDEGIPLVFAEGRTSWTDADVDEHWYEEFNYTKLAEVDE